MTTRKHPGWPAWADRGFLTVAFVVPPSGGKRADRDRLKPELPAGDARPRAGLGKIARCAAVALVAALGLAGCATPGPLHVYSLPSVSHETVLDAGDGRTAEVPSFIAADEQLTGFAYDPFTDHFFLRLAPGNLIRVVDRPARAVKREFEGERLPATGGGDLAVRPRDGHLFLLHPGQPEVLELTRLGRWVRTIPLAATTTPAAGIAYDATQDRLLVLDGAQATHISVHDLAGRRLGGLTLERAVAGSLAFDAVTREIYAPLAGRDAGIGVFDEQGRLRRTLAPTAVGVDVGPRSFVRVF